MEKSKLVKIQGFTSFKESKIWQIQSDYYKNNGLESWVSGQVPFGITGNSRLAYQKAKVIIESIKNIPLKDNDEIFILEIAAGQGSFTLNFLKVFEQICFEKRLNYYERLVYLFTDYSKKTLLEVSKNPFIKEKVKQGKLKLYILDSFKNIELTSLSGETKVLHELSISAVIANYAYCTFPASIIRKENESFFERVTEIYYKSSNKKSFENDIKNPKNINIMKKIVEKDRFEKINIDSYFEEKEEIKTIKEITENFFKASVIYPDGTLKSIKNLLPTIKSKGVFLISDKGYSSDEYMYGLEEIEASIHGNSIAYPLNIPIIKKYIKNIGFNAFSTDSPFYSIQTLLIEKSNRQSRNTVLSFKSHFVDNNLNEDLNDFIQVARDYEEKELWDDAIRFYLKIIKYRKRDAGMLFSIGQCFFYKSDYLKALEYFQSNFDDYFSLFDFDFEIGQVMYMLGKYEKSLNYYSDSIKKFGENKYCFYNIALVWESLENYNKAIEFYDKALKIDSNYLQARESLNRLKKIKPKNNILKIFSINKEK